MRVITLFWLIVCLGVCFTAFWAVFGHGDDVERCVVATAMLVVGWALRGAHERETR